MSARPYPKLDRSKRRAVRRIFWFGLLHTDAMHHSIWGINEPLQRKLESECPLCGHEWRRHDPEDGCCDAPGGVALSVAVCQCGRDMAWMHSRVAALSRAALEAGVPT